MTPLYARKSILITAPGSDEDQRITTGRQADLIVTDDGADFIHAGMGNDVIFAGNGNDSIFAGRGNDVIFGGNGSDTISGGFGIDTLIGGSGCDTFVFRIDQLGGVATDRIRDFSANDRFALNVANPGDFDLIADASLNDLFQQRDTPTFLVVDGTLYFDDDKGLFPVAVARIGLTLITADQLDLI